MLDSFIKVACSRSEKLAERDRLVEKMHALPDELLMKIASGEEKVALSGCLSTSSEDGGSWLDRFKGTPLLPQAIELEKQELQEQMAQRARWREDSQAATASNAMRDELYIHRKLLELQLAELSAGGGEAQAFAGQETPEEEALEHGAGSPEVAAAQAQQPAPAPAAPKEESPEKAAMKLAYARMKMADALTDARSGARGAYGAAAYDQRKPTVQSVRAVGDQEIADDADDYAGVAQHMEEHPGRVRASRGLAGAGIGGALGSGVGAMFGRPGVGAAVGAGLGGLGLAAAPVNPQGPRDMSEALRSLSPEERDQLAQQSIDERPAPPTPAQKGALIGSGLGLAGGMVAGYKPKSLLAATAPLTGTLGGMGAGALIGKLVGRKPEEQAEEQPVAPGLPESKMAAAFKKEAIGLGLLGTAAGGAAKSIGGAGMKAFQAARGFGSSLPQAARMGASAVAGQAPGALKTLGRAATSYAKANPLQAAGIAGAAGLGAGYALS
jgi:hypothetical protein